MSTPGVTAALLLASLASASGADVFFDDTYVHEIRLYFDDANWYSTLYQSHSSDPEDPYFPARFVPTVRAVHSRLYVNDEYWGLYTAVEQIDTTFARAHFGAEEDGNLYKAQSSDEGSPSSDFGSDLPPVASLLGGGRAVLPGAAGRQRGRPTGYRRCHPDPPVPVPGRWHDRA